MRLGRCAVALVLLAWATSAPGVLAQSLARLAEQTRARREQGATSRVITDQDLERAAGTRPASDTNPSPHTPTPLAADQGASAPAAGRGRPIKSPAPPPSAPPVSDAGAASDPVVAPSSGDLLAVPKRLTAGVRQALDARLGQLRGNAEALDARMTQLRLLMAEVERRELAVALDREWQELSAALARIRQDIAELEKIR